MRRSRIPQTLLMRNVAMSKRRSRRRSERRSYPLLTFANADTRGRAVNGPHASVSLPSHDPLWVTGKQELTRWLG